MSDAFEYDAIDEAPDAEALYRSLKDQLATHLASRGERTTRLVGIHSGGTWVAQRLHEELGVAGAVGALDISFYRDDFNRIGLHGQVKPTEIDFEVDGADILLVDDVLYSGRTIRGALNVLFDYGRPARVDLAVLVDRQTPERDAREMPIAARWSGARLCLPREREFVLSNDDAVFSLAVAQTPRPLSR